MYVRMLCVCIYSILRSFLAKNEVPAVFDDFLICVCYLSHHQKTNMGVLLREVVGTYITYTA